MDPKIGSSDVSLIDRAFFTTSSTSLEDTCILCFFAEDDGVLVLVAEDGLLSSVLPAC
jgi:hypothetical protein